MSLLSRGITYAIVALFVVFSVGCTKPTNNDTAARLRGADTAFMPDIGKAGTVRFINAFPNLRFELPTNVVGVPGTDQVIVLEHYRGLAHIFPNVSDISETRIFLDLSDRVVGRGELGLVEITFDPDFDNNGWVYVVSSAGPGFDPVECNPFCSVISRFTVDPDSPQFADRTSEKVLLKLRQPNNDAHNISNVVFGPDGMMYVSSGDGAYQSHARVNAQRRTDLFGKILRYDARSPEGLRIPRDNPFVGAGLEEPGVPGAGEPIREEIFAYGLRNPYRLSFDPASGRIIVGDVGQSLHEEINFVVAGANYGWPVFEGTREHQRDDVGRSREDFTFPVLQYGTLEEISAIVGGFVYRADQFPQLRGQYLFGDFLRGTLWSMDPDAEVRPIPKSEVTQLDGAGLATLELVHGEVFATSYSGGSIHKLIHNNPDATVLPPERLSESGLFADLSTLQASDGVVPYSINAPLWSDGAEKHRWIALPESGVIQIADNGQWNLPVGTVLVKHFSTSADSTSTRTAKNLETRVLLHAENGWQAFTYVWNDEQTDALLTTGGQVIAYEQQTGSDVTRVDYHVPSSSDCSTCHNGSAGFILGLSSGQIDRPAASPLGLADESQLDALVRHGLLAGSIPPSEARTPWADVPDLASSTDLRARSYLAANCAHCHNPKMGLPSSIDMRFETPLAETGLLDVRPRGDDFGLDEARLIAPGNSASSVLLKRMAIRGNGQMPPLATRRVDNEALALVRDWIDGLPQEPSDRVP